MGYHSCTLLRYVSYALPLLILLLALFGFAVEILDVEPKSGSVIKLAVFDQQQVPAQLVFGAWLVEASGLLAIFLLAQGRCGAWWLDGLVAGWLAWIFRGPLLVVTIVVAAGQPQYAWWSLAFGWWVLYSICGLSLSILARRCELDLVIGASGAQGRHERLQARREEAAAGVLAAETPQVETPQIEPSTSETAESPPLIVEESIEEPTPTRETSAISATTAGDATEDVLEERASPWSEQDEER